MKNQRKKAAEKRRTPKKATNSGLLNRLPQLCPSHSRRVRFGVEVRDGNRIQQPGSQGLVRERRRGGRPILGRRFLNEDDFRQAGCGRWVLDGAFAQEQRPAPPALV